MHFVSTLLTIPQPFHPPRKNLASATAGAPACQKIAYILFPTFLQSPGPSTHPVKVWRALPRGHLRVRKLHTSCFQNFGNPRAFPPPPRKNWRALPQGHLRVRKLHTFVFQKCWQSNLASATAGHLRVKNCIQIISKILAIPQPFPSPRKNLVACQKLHAFYFQLFCSPGPCTHPVKIWRALPRGHLRVRKLRTFFLQFLQSFGPSSERYRGGTCVSENCMHFVSKILTILELFHLHPVEIWRALPLGDLRVRKMHKLHTCYF